MARELLVGRRIIDAFYDGQAGETRLVVALDNNTAFTVESDDAGNQAGALQVYPAKPGVQLRVNRLPRLRSGVSPK